jgi:asparagine synthase (glutamine-hydrolysing)
MCGIAGIINQSTGDRSADVDRMVDALVHRGPDGVGRYGNQHLNLGMRRLSIIDLAGGDQPLFNEDRSLVLIANGEIYNYVELRRELIDRGHHFRTHSDCEVIVHLYEDHQQGCLERLRGMFAFALWDEKRKMLMLARDRMGEKPLYLYESEGELVFSSELKSILRSGRVRFQLDPQSIDSYFHFGYVPEPQTPLQGVRKLPAGHCLTARLADRSVGEAPGLRIEERAYWCIENAPPVAGSPAELIGAELETISRLIVRADVPVGVALSGGLDSSAVAALANRASPGRIEAFTVGYDGHNRNDERGLAREFAAHLQIPLHDIVLRTDEVVAGFPALTSWQDDPIADIAGSGYLAVMRLAREHGVPVILQGHGGDELCWGYQWARQAVLQSRRKFDHLVRGGLALTDYLKMHRPRTYNRGTLLRWIHDLGGIRSSIDQYRRDRSSPVDRLVFYDLSPDFREAQREMARHYTRPFLESLAATDPADLFNIATGSLARTDEATLEVEITRLLCATYLMENGVAQGDRLSMASSVELRLPLIDYRLVELLIGLRKSQPDAGLKPKQRLREALTGILPPWVMARPKRGFTPPVRQWHRRLFNAYGGRLRNGYLVQSGILSPAAGAEFAGGTFPFGVTAPLSFKALVLEQWCRNFQA